MNDYTATDAIKANIDWYLSRNIDVTKIHAGTKDNLKGAPSVTNSNELYEWVDGGGNIGFRPGETLLIIDADVKDGKPGRISYESLNLPSTRTVKTPSGGFHFYFRIPSGLHIPTKIADLPGIDLLSGDQNVVAPGSRLSNGRSTGDYRLVIDIDPVLLPDEVLQQFMSAGCLNEEHKSSEHDPVGIELVRFWLDQLRNAPPVIDHYDTWLRVIAAINYETEGSAEGLKLAEEWSAQRGPESFENFDAGRLYKTWHSFGRGQGGTISTLKTIEYLVRQQKPTLEEVADQIVKPPSEHIEEPSEHIEEPSEHIEEPSELIEAVEPVVVESAGDGFLPGVAGLIEQWVMSRQRFQSPTVARVAALHCLSALADNKWVVQGELTPLNLFSLLIMPTGKGKEALRQCIGEFVGEFLPPITVGESQEGVPINRISSGPGLANMLTRRKNRAWLPDEFGLFLKTASDDRGTHHSDIVAAFMAGFSSARGTMFSQQYAKSKDCSEPVEKPYIQCAATTTGSTLADAMGSSGFMEAGLVNRALPVVCEDIGERRFNIGHTPIPFAVTEWGIEFTNYTGGLSDGDPEEIAVSDDAMRLIQAAARRWDKVEDYAVLWSRAYENVLKLSGLVALGTNGRMIDVEIARWAIGAVETGYKEFLSMFMLHVGRNRQREHEQDRIEKAIERLSGKPIKQISQMGEDVRRAWEKGAVARRDVFKSLKLSAREGNERVKDLVEQGRITEIEVKNVNGRKPLQMLALIDT